jgi:hypothetical protein
MFCHRYLFSFEIAAFGNGVGHQTELGREQLGLNGDLGACAGYR